MRFASDRLLEADAEAGAETRLTLMADGSETSSETDSEAEAETEAEVDI